MFTFTDPMLTYIEKKVKGGQRLSFNDGMILLKSPDLLGIGYLANIVRESKNGNNTYFICNRHINYSNICKNRCRFCAFSKDKNDSSAYDMSVADVMSAVSAYNNVKEFHIVGGLHPEFPFDYYLELLSTLRQKYPHIHIQAFTAVEIDNIADAAKLSVRETLIRLRDAGLGSLPGGGAEVFDRGVRAKICPEKIDGARWLEIMKIAHEIGIKSNATMLYGHIEENEHRISHLIKLRELQDKTGGFMSFIPLAFHPINTDLNGLLHTTANLDLRMLAVSRLMLDNFPHIKSFWIMIGLKLAQISLSFGVDDIDGTVAEERITHSAGAATDQSVEMEELIRIIKDAGRMPVERDTLYNRL